jgi:hypothetical protein
MGIAKQSGANIYRARDRRRRRWPGFYTCVAIFIGVVIIALAVYLALTA